MGKNDKELLIGWSQKSITPDKPVLLSGQMYTRISKGVKDPVTVTTLALEGSGSQAILISAELVGIPHEVQDIVREKVAAKIPDFDPMKLVINATHTHTSLELRQGCYPEPGDKGLSTLEVIEFFAEQTATVAAEAWQNRSAGGISRAYSNAVIAHNRRSVFFDGSAKMYANIDAENFSGFEGYVDHGLNIVCTWDTDKELTGMIVNVPCPSQVTENLHEISADYWHETRLALRERFGSEIHILGQCAPSGDLSPHVQLNKKLEEEEMLSRLGRNQREEIAKRITSAIDWVYEACEATIQTEVEFAHVAESIELPRRMVTEAEYEQAKASLKKLEADKEAEEERVFRPRKRDQDIIKRFENQKDNPEMAMELHVLKFNDLVMATNPFEIFLDFGLRIKARSKAAQTVLVQLACDYAGYLPTQKAVESKLHEADKNRPGFLGNYSAGVASNQIGPEGGQVLVEETLKRIDTLLDDI